MRERPAAPSFVRSDSSRPAGRSRRGATLSVIAGGISLSALLLVGALSLPSPHPAMATMAPASDHELAVTLTRLHLDPEPLAAAGVTAEQTTALVARVREHLQANMDDIRAAEQDLADAHRAVDLLTRRIQDGTGSEKDVAQLATAQTTITSARATLDAELDAVRAAASEGLGDTARAVLQSCAANAPWRHDGLPTQYVCVQRSQQQWADLRDALSNLRITSRHGEEPNPNAQELVSTADADTATVAATTNLNALLNNVQTAWNTAVYRE